MKFPFRNNKAAKLTPADVMKIRELYAHSAATQGQLAVDFGVTAVQIGRITRGEVWQQLPPASATKEEINESAQRMLKVQEEVGMERLQREAEKLKEGDRMLDELSNAGDLP